MRQAWEVSDHVSPNTSSELQPCGLTANTGVWTDKLSLGERHASAPYGLDVWEDALECVGSSPTRSIFIAKH